MTLSKLVFKDNSVVVVGLGYVGLTLAVHMANRGFQVHGVEIRKDILTQLNHLEGFFLEPGLNDLLEKVVRTGNFTFSQEIPKSSQNRVFIITVGTPLNSQGQVNTNQIIRAARSVCSALNQGDLCILRSTVKLGTTNSVVRPILNESKYSYGLAYCPERTLEGDALRELSHVPQIIGSDSEDDKFRAIEIFNRVTCAIVPVSNIETAEMIKLIDNMQRDVFFGVANEVARACNQLLISPHEVISAGKLGYPRTNLPFPGPVGGPCLEKDSYILNESLGWENSISLSARNTNELLVPESSIFLQQTLNDFSAIELGCNKPIQFGFLGLAFKGVPETDDLRGSVGLKLLNELLAVYPSAVAVVYDPVVKQLEQVSPRVKLVHSIEEAFKDSQVVVLTNNHPKFTDLNIIDLGRAMKDKGLIYDLWGRYPTHLDKNGHLVFSWGTFALARKWSTS